MITKQDFLQAIEAGIDDYPAIAPLWRAKDPRILQHIEAIATMCSMLSQQVEVAQAEVFNKTRTGTVLADMGNKGIYQTSSPLTCFFTVSNAAHRPAVGRRLVDSNGRYWEVIGWSNSAIYFSAAQVVSQTYRHTIAVSEPYLSIAFPRQTDDGTVCSVSVRHNGLQLEQSDRYMNVGTGEQVYAIDVDDVGEMSVRFGEEGRVGVQPKAGDTVEIVVQYSHGNIKSPSSLSFEYITTPAESSVTLSFDSVMVPGKNPPSIEKMREWARYPAIYDTNAVFLGEFSLLLQRKFPDLVIRVWNEAEHEILTGSPDVRNVNCLFVASSNQYATSNASPKEITSKNGVMQEMERVIKRADNSYRVRFFELRRAEATITVTGTCPSSYDATVVGRKIISAIKGRYGGEKVATAKLRDVYALIRSEVPEMVQADADFSVVINGLQAYKPDTVVELGTVTANITRSTNQTGVL